MSFEAMDDLGKGGTALAFVGGLLGLVPALERLLHLGPGWQASLTVALLAVGILAGAGLALAGYGATGGVLAIATGLLLAVFGPTSAGVIGLVGGLLLFISVGRAAQREQPSPERPAGGP